MMDNSSGIDSWSIFNVDIESISQDVKELFTRMQDFLRLCPERNAQQQITFICKLLELRNLVELSCTDLGRDLSLDPSLVSHSGGL